NRSTTRRPDALITTSRTPRSVAPNSSATIRSTNCSRRRRLQPARARQRRFAMQEFSRNILRALAIVALFLVPSQVYAQDARPNMAPVPTGDFWMGRTHYFLVDAIGWFERDRQDDTPAHKIFVDSFFMDKYEVTNQDYEKFATATNRAKPWHWVGGKIPKGEERVPVYNVTWFDADAYCKSVGKRLPTEAEWEKAARGGLDRAKYPW